MELKKVIFIVGLIIALCTNFAWGHSIDGVVLQNEGTTVVEISGVFTDGCERELTIITASTADAVTINVFGPITNFIEGRVPFYLTQEIIPPEVISYQIHLRLYDKNPDENADARILASTTLDVDQDVDTGGGDEGDADEPALLEVMFDIKPEKLNLKSRGEWVSARIGVPEEYFVEDIDIESIQLEDTIEVARSEIEDGILKLKFSRKDVIDVIKAKSVEPAAYVELTITGILNADNEKLLEASDIIRLTNNKNGKGEK